MIIELSPYKKKTIKSVLFDRQRQFIQQFINIKQAFLTYCNIKATTEVMKHCQWFSFKNTYVVLEKLNRITNMLKELLCQQVLRKFTKFSHGILSQYVQLDSRVSRWIQLLDQKGEIIFGTFKREVSNELNNMKDFYNLQLNVSKFLKKREIRHLMDHNMTNDIYLQKITDMKHQLMSSSYFPEDELTTIIIYVEEQR
jgi:hypothetical protein